MKAEKKSESIDSYLQDQPAKVQRLLKKLRQTIKKAAPDAQEAISYGIPTFKLNGNLVHFAAFTNHVGFYPTSSGIKAFRKRLASFKVSKGTVQFPLDEPIPFALVSEIVSFRVNENLKKKARPKVLKAKRSKD